MSTEIGLNIKSSYITKTFRFNIEIGHTKILLLNHLGFP